MWMAFGGTIIIYRRRICQRVFTLSLDVFTYTPRVVGLKWHPPSLVLLCIPAWRWLEAIIVHRIFLSNDVSSLYLKLSYSHCEHFEWAKRTNGWWRSRRRMRIDNCNLCVDDFRPQNVMRFAHWDVVRNLIHPKRKNAAGCLCCARSTQTTQNSTRWMCFVCEKRRWSILCAASSLEAR